VACIKAEIRTSVIAISEFSMGFGLWRIEGGM
jgi:hypothetical protein